MTEKDRARIRALAQRQLALANGDENRALEQEWIRHGDMKADTRPMLRVELWTFEGDILPPLMECADEDARRVEAMLLRNIVNRELFRDDTLVPDHIGTRPNAWFIPFGLKVAREETGGVGHRFVSHIKDLEEDFHKLGPSQYGVDREKSARDEAFLEELIGDILPVRPDGFSLYATPTQDIVHIMSMEDMFVAMYDSPALFHRMMDLLTADYENYFRMFEREGLLKSAARAQHLAQGTYCFTDALPDGKENATLKDMWLYMDSQETSGVSPEMYREFVFPYYERLMKLCGLASYGCCEAVNAIWPGCLSTVENIRKVSISPWCDEEKMGKALQSRKTVYLRKPSPNLLGVGEALNEEATLDHFRHTAKCASGCKLEIAVRDVYRVGAWQKVRRFVELAREGLSDYTP
jgi:hypothetical protein